MLGEEAIKKYSSLFNFIKEDSVLDLGCGDGTLLKLAAANGAFFLVGVDMSDTQLCLASDKLKPFANVKLINETMQNISFQQEMFTKISARKSLHHLTNDEKGNLINKCYKWLKQEGIFIIEDLILTFDINDIDKRRSLIEKEAFQYYGLSWSKVRDAVFTTIYKEVPCDLKQITAHLLSCGFNVMKIINVNSFICTIISQK